MAFRTACDDQTISSMEDATNAFTMKQVFNIELCVCSNNELNHCILGAVANRCSNR